MITYHYLTDFKLENHPEYTEWIISCLKSFKRNEGQLQYIFCSDEELLGINQRYLNHDFYTDIITFQYGEHPFIAGDIYISVDRVRDNAATYQVPFENELKRVMIHGVLHMLGFKDSAPEEKLQMRAKEEEMIQMFHVKH
ncbi:MAG: rRNA maturation RNase YbeY [Robiginitalea sp.]